jgi:hypothetical protein
LAWGFKNPFQRRGSLTLSASSTTAAWYSACKAWELEALRQKITGEGRIFVEEQARKQDSVIHEYRERPSNFVVVMGTGHQVAMGNEGPVIQTALGDDVRKCILALLDQIEEKIRSDASFGERQDDLLTDVASARTQIEKDVPNRRAVSEILDPLAKVAAISGPVLRVIELLA